MDPARAFIGFHAGQAYVGLYKPGIEAITVALLGYIGFTDFRTLKVHNWSIAALLVLYVLYAVIARSTYEIVFDVVLAGIIFGALLWFYQKGVVGGGDVKFLPVVCLWVGVNCALLFSVLLLLFVSLHLAVTKLGWAPTRSLNGGRAIAYAPAISGALICTIVLGCL
jgi:Flp pilus assembly protein protease CpaA